MKGFIMSKLSILVVDDQPEMLEQAKKTIKKYYSNTFSIIEEANCVRDASVKIDEQQFDILIVDHNMPAFADGSGSQVPGTELLRYMNMMFHKHEQPITIGWSSETDTLQKLIDAGADYGAKKDYSVADVLKDSLKQAIEAANNRSSEP